MGGPTYAHALDDHTIAWPAMSMLSSLNTLVEGLVEQERIALRAGTRLNRRAVREGIVASKATWISALVAGLVTLAQLLSGPGSAEADAGGGLTTTSTPVAGSSTIE